MNASEERLKSLLLRGLDGDAPAYQAFLMEMSTHLRAYFRKRLARLPDEVEDLVQESLLAIPNKRHPYDAAPPLTARLHRCGIVGTGPGASVRTARACGPCPHCRRASTGCGGGRPADEGARP